MRTVLIATVKNEGPFLLEWVAWHRLIGFGHIIIAQNDSDDLTTEILQCLHDIGAIHFIENTPVPDGANPTGNHQMRAYKRASDLAIYGQADWAMTLDCDEFLVITTGGGKVHDLIVELGQDVDQIRVHWCHFGSNGESTFQDDLVTTRFVETHPADRAIKIKTSFKTLFRRQAFARVGVHQPKPQHPDLGRAVTASGVVVEPDDMDGVMSVDPGGQKFAQVFHYQIRDAESFTLAKMRGRPSVGTPYFESLGYWASGDAMDRKTDHLQRESGRILDEIDHLDGLSGGRLAALHRASVDLWKDRAAALRHHPEYGAFYAQICRLQMRLRGPDRRQALIELYDAGELKWRPK